MTLVDNVARFPKQTINSCFAAPASLRDVSADTLTRVTKIWAREGLRSKVLELAEMPGITPSMRATMLRACRAQVSVH